MKQPSNPGVCSQDLSPSRVRSTAPNRLLWLGLIGIDRHRLSPADVRPDCCREFSGVAPGNDVRAMDRHLLSQAGPGSRWWVSRAAVWTERLNVAANRLNGLAKGTDSMRDL